MGALTVLLLVAFGQGQSQAPDPSLIRVYVHTADGGHAEELAARRTSLKDLATALAARKKLIVVIDDEDRADVSIEIMGRAIEVPRVVIGLAGRPGDPPSPGLVRLGTLNVSLESGPVTLRLSNKNRTNDNPGGWKSAAENVADQTEKWIREHREAILKRRPGTPSVVRRFRVHDLGLLHGWQAHLLARVGAPVGRLRPQGDRLLPPG
jgi:hypothetical protein